MNEERIKALLRLFNVEATTESDKGTIVVTAQLNIADGHISVSTPVRESMIDSTRDRDIAVILLSKLATEVE